jgi:hypothetical protein
MESSTGGEGNREAVGVVRFSRRLYTPPDG